MKTKMAWVAGVIVVALGLTFAGTSLAQTTTTIVPRNFEVLAVDGNKLVVRDEKGTQEITVPDDFRFTVDGKKMAVSDLKPGMKGIARGGSAARVGPVGDRAHGRWDTPVHPGGIGQGGNPGHEGRKPGPAR